MPQRSAWHNTRGVAIQHEVGGLHVDARQMVLDQPEEEMMKAGPNSSVGEVPWWCWC